MSNNINDWLLLIVEDEPDGQAVVTGLLQIYNINADAVGTAEEALQQLEHNHYDAVIIDLNLPGIDGIELVSIIRDNPALHDLPCVAITAYHASSVKQQALHAGFDAYFAKPLDDTGFVRSLERVIQENN